MSNMTVEVRDNTRTIGEVDLIKINEILLRRKNTYFLQTSCWRDEELPHDKAMQLIASINANIMSYGYTLDTDALNLLRDCKLTISKNMLTFLYTNMSAILSVLTGGDLKYKPM